MGELLSLLKDIIIGIWDYLKFLKLVDHWEESVILRNGKFDRSLKPGLYFKLPFFERDLVANVKPDTMDIEPVCITTLDKKTISIGVVLSYQVYDVKKFLVDHNDSPSNMVDITRGRLSDLIEDIGWDETKKKTTRTKLKNNLKEEFDKMGVIIMEVMFTDKSEVRALKLFTNNQKNKPSIA